MCSQGPLSPGAIVNDSSAGGAAFVGPSNVASPDGTYAVAVVIDEGGYGRSQYLRCTGFGFSLPEDAVVVGIKVEVEAKADAPHVACYNSAFLLKGGVPVGDDRGEPSGVLATADGWFVLGGLDNQTTTLWGVDWSAAEVNDPDFGVIVSFFTNAPPTTVSVDTVRITVFYRLPAINAA